MAAGLGPRLLALALALGPAGVWAQWRLVESGGGLQAAGDSVHLSCQGSGFNFRSYHVLWYRQAPSGRIEWVSFINTSGVWAQWRLVESGGGLQAAGNSVKLSCQGSGFTFSSFAVWWYRQAPGGSLERVSYIGGLSGTTKQYGAAVKGRATASRDNSRAESSLSLHRLHVGDSARYFCAVGAGHVTAPLIFGKGTQLTVEPSNQEDSDPEVILIKSKPLEEGGSTGKAACLARNFYPKNINLDMLPAEVIYEQNTPIVTSEGTYNTIKVVNVTKASEVSCTAKFKGNFFTANATSSEKVVEEPITANVCNTTDTSSKGDIKTEKTNMLSMAVLGLRVLLAKSIAFNTLMSIKLFLF